MLISLSLNKLRFKKNKYAIRAHTRYQRIGWYYCYYALQKWHSIFAEMSSNKFAWNFKNNNKLQAIGSFVESLFGTEKKKSELYLWERGMSSVNLATLGRYISRSLSHSNKQVFYVFSVQVRSAAVLPLLCVCAYRYVFFQVCSYSTHYVLFLARSIQLWCFADDKQILTASRWDSAIKSELFYLICSFFPSTNSYEAAAKLCARAENEPLT